jgi:2-C-methyl-D-erythritol 2,4-cyclodiphosphate synthase
MIRIGQGFDVHKFGGEGPITIGGVSIPHTQGLVAHSDGDVLLHALSDALLGALALGDIGKHFPDNDAAFKNVDSRILLRKVVELTVTKGYRVANVDMTIIAQSPRMAPFIDSMRANISQDLDCDIDAVSVKATTTETLGFTGRREGIAAQAVVLVTRNQQELDANDANK